MLALAHAFDLMNLRAAEGDVSKDGAATDLGFTRDRQDEARRSAVRRLAMVRDTLLRNAPHHEADWSRSPDGASALQTAEASVIRMSK